MKLKLGIVSVVVACCGCGLSADDAAGSLRKRAVPKKQAKQQLIKKAPRKAAQDRATILRAVKGLGDLDQVRVPVFRDTVKPGERAKLVARLDRALTEMKAEKGVPKDVLDGVRVWESLDQKQRLGLLSGDYGQVAAIPTWAVAAVGAAHLTYEVGKDYNWWASSREKFNLERMQTKDLDYVASKLGAVGERSLRQPEIIGAIKAVDDLKKIKVPVLRILSPRPNVRSSRLVSRSDLPTSRTDPSCHRRSMRELKSGRNSVRSNESIYSPAVSPQAPLPLSLRPLP